MNILKIVNAKRAFTNHLDDKIPPAVAYKIMKLVRIADDEESFYRQELQKIIGQYGKRNEDGSFATTSVGNIVLEEETAQECHSKIKELEALEVDTPNIQFTLDELSCVSMTVREMDAISEFISDEC